MATTELTRLEGERASVALRHGSLDRVLDSTGIWPIMVAATALYLLVFVGYPVVYNVGMSLQVVTVSNLRSFDRPWVGLANYKRLFADPLFPVVLRNTLIFVALNVV